MYYKLIVIYIFWFIILTSTECSNIMGRAFTTLFKFPVCELPQRNNEINIPNNLYPCESEFSLIKLAMINVSSIPFLSRTLLFFARRF